MKYLPGELRGQCGAGWGGESLQKRRYPGEGDLRHIFEESIEFGLCKAEKDVPHKCRSIPFRGTLGEWPAWLGWAVLLGGGLDKCTEPGTGSTEMTS